MAAWLSVSVKCGGTIVHARQVVEVLVRIPWPHSSLCKRVIPNHFNENFHMTISELNETWYASNNHGCMWPDKISLSYVSMWC